MVVRTLTVTFVLVLRLDAIFGFNLDTVRPVIYSNGVKHSSFGYTVALYNDGKASSSKWVLVGAPHGNSSSSTYKDIVEPGVLFKCKINNRRDNICEEAAIEKTGNEFGDFNGHGFKSRNDHGMLGGSLDVSSRPGGMVVVCSPRWKNSKRARNYYMNGACYYMKKRLNEKRVERTLPLVDIENRITTYPGRVYFWGLGEAGLSVHIPENSSSSDLVMGAPGVLNWVGSVILQENTRNLLVPNPRFTDSLREFDYTGYAVSSGRFFSDKEIYYVAGAPRGAEYKGKIIIFSFPSQEESALNILISKEGEQMGEYFGSALCVVDFNDDGFDDLLVGAPFYIPEDLKDISWNEGRVFVYLNNQKEKLIQMPHIFGSKTVGAQFGTAITTLGDINQDGYKDVAIGAPFEKGGQGAVYIYLGSSSGLNQHHSQVISAADVGFPGELKGFGFSIAKGMDIDENNYPDVAIGSYMSGKAVVLRSKPVIQFLATLQAQPESIDLNATEFRLEVCLAYTGVHLPDDIEAAVRIQTDTQYQPARAKLSVYKDLNRNHMYYETLNKTKTECKRFRVEIVEAGAIDYTIPIRIKMTYMLRPPGAGEGDAPGTHAVRVAPAGTVGNLNDFCQDCPVVDPSHVSSQKKEIEVAFIQDCGKDERCVADLEVEGVFPHISNRSVYVIGESKTITLDVSVINRGEIAFIPAVEVNIPSPVTLTQIPKICHEEPGEGDLISLKLICSDLPNPMFQGDQVKFTIILDMTAIKAGKEMLMFEMRTSTASEQKRNTTHVELPLRTEADMAIRGHSGRDQYIYTRQETKMNRIVFNHIYEVSKYGPSPVESVNLDFLIPINITTSNEIYNFLQIYNPKAYINKQPFTCHLEEGQFHIEDGNTADESGTEGVSEDEPISKELNITKGKASTRRRRSLQRSDVPIEEEMESSLSLQADLPPDSKMEVTRIRFLNCSTPNVQCARVMCKNVGPFRGDDSKAEITLKLGIDMQIVEPLMEGKESMVLGTEGRVRLVNLPESVQGEGHRADVDKVSTRFVGEFPEEKLALWIIIVAAVGGVLLLALIIFGCWKAGFFRRNVRKELKDLKRKSQMVHSPVLLDDDVDDIDVEKDEQKM